MNKGFTTGSCAAAASKAAAFMLLSGQKKLQIEIDTPAGVKYNPQIEEIEIGEGYVSCAVRKQSGDDPDITNGTLVFSRVSYCDGNNNQVVNDENKHYDNRNEAANTNDEIIKNRKVYIDGGKGVGRVTRPGLDQPVGNAAINSVPRKMIEAEVKQVMDLFDYDKSLEVIISVPEGEELAAKTFNPRLGIEGGISIIGTTGIVEPMSTKVLLDTIMVELRQMKVFHLLPLYQG